MKKIIILASVAVLALAVVLGAAKTMAAKPAQADRAVKIKGATSDNPVVYLGKAFDKKSGQEVEGYAIVHFAAKPAKPTRPGGGTTCYGYIAKGAKWKTNEPWVVDSVNTGNLDANFLLTNLSGDIAKWEDATDGNVTNGSGVNVLGEGTLSGAPIATSGTLNDQNEITFAPIQNQGAIAVTYLWGIFGGPVGNRQIVEWDQVYNTAYHWSAAGAAGEMDFENIATHELGHSFGMNDLYTASCNLETMYGYADYGQTIKRDLNGGDITGINLLY